MRRFLGLVAGILLLASCSESNDPYLVDSPEGVVPSPSVASEIVDGSSGDPAANPYFFFLPTIAAKGPGDTGAPAVGLSPVVTVCPMGAWDVPTESCSSPFAVLSKEPDLYGTTLSEKEGAGEYGVAFKHSNYPFQAGDVFRVAVGIAGRVLGWADVKAYDVSGPSPRVDEDGYVILDTGTENFNISFRIAEGALEAEFCDLSNIEDCDVEIFAYEDAGCLRVFENPGDVGETLGSQACVPANAAELDGAPVEGEYAVILTLEEAGQFQGGDVPASSQVRFLSDLKTDPPGIEFNPASGGAGVVICQEPFEAGGIPDELHEQLRPFIVYSNGETVLPGRDEYSFGAPECEGFGAHPHIAASTAPGTSSKGFLDRLAAGVTKASSFFLPQPLHARRLHGGLNTTVYDTKSSRDGGGDASPSQATMVIQQAEEPFVVELGALLDLDPSSSVASVPTSGKVGEESTVTVNVLNAQSLPFPFEVPVVLTVTSDSDEFQVTADFQGGGVYSATYAPTTAGTNLVTISIDGFEIAGSPFSMDVLPVVGDLTVVVDISGGAPADGLPVYLYEGTNSDPLLEASTDAGGEAFFPQIEVGKSYTIHLPKRDFDVTFSTMTQTIDFQEAARTVTFHGTSQDLGPGVRVFRVKEPQGTGNAYKYVIGGRSWNSAQNQVQGDYLLGVQGHLVDILGPEENSFVANFFYTDPSLCPDETNEKKCKYKGWIGLTDDAVEGQFEWTTGVAPSYYNWPNGQTAADQPEDRKGNLDHVEIGLSGIWGIINGASSTNEGYFVEWDVEWPGTPPFSG